MIRQLSTGTVEVIVSGGTTTVQDFNNLLSLESLNKLLELYKEESKLPEDLPVAIDSIVEYLPKMRGPEKKEMKRIGTEWINTYHNQIPKHVYNQL